MNICIHSIILAIYLVCRSLCCNVHLTPFPQHFSTIIFPYVFGLAYNLNRLHSCSHPITYSLIFIILFSNKIRAF